MKLIKLETTIAVKDHTTVYFSKLKELWAWRVHDASKLVTRKMLIHAN